MKSHRLSLENDAGVHYVDDLSHPCRRELETIAESLAEGLAMRPNVE